MFYLTTHSTHFIYGYMASDIWLRTILIVRKETRCRHIGYSFRLTARVLLYAPSHREDNTYHGLCYTSRGALLGIQVIKHKTLLKYNIWAIGRDTRKNHYCFPFSNFGSYVRVCLDDGKTRNNVLMTRSKHLIYMFYDVGHVVKDHY